MHTTDSRPDEIGVVALFGEQLEHRFEGPLAFLGFENTNRWNVIRNCRKGSVLRCASPWVCQQQFNARAVDSTGILPERSEISSDLWAWILLMFHKILRTPNGLSISCFSSKNSMIPVDQNRMRKLGTPVLRTVYVPSRNTIFAQNRPYSSAESRMNGQWVRSWYCWAAQCYTATFDHQTSTKSLLELSWHT